MTSSKLKFLKKLKIKKYRDREKLFLIEGFHLVEEAIKANIVEEIYASIDFPNSIMVSNEIIESLSTNKTPQPIIALCKKITPKKISSNKVLVLEKINDPGNLGTLIRSALAFGFQDLIVEGVEIYNPKVLQASQGAFFSVNILEVKNSVEEISKYKNYQYLVTSLGKDSEEFEHLAKPEKIMLVLGNESKGISSEMKKIATHLIFIKTNFESLNIASAGAILMNHYKR